MRATSPSSREMTRPNSLRTSSSFAAIADALCISFNELGYAVHVIEMDNEYYGNPEYGFADVRDYPEFDNAPFESAFDSDELPF